MNLKNAGKKNPGPAVLLAALMMIVVLAGCSPEAGDPVKDTSPDDQTGTTLALQGTRPAAAPVAAGFVRSARALSRAPGDPVVLEVLGTDGSVTGTITLTGARIVVEEFEFESETEATDESDIDNEAGFEFEGPYLADLLANTVTPPIDPIDIPEGVYNKIEFSIHTIDGSEDDGNSDPLVEPTDPLFGNSVHLTGTYTGASASGPAVDVPFVLTLDVDESVELKNVGEEVVGFTISAEELNSIIVAFRFPKWFEFDNPETNPTAVDFSAVTADGGGIVLDASASGDNAVLLSVIEANIKKSADYGRDSDEDGELESGEDDDPDSLDDGDDGRDASD